MSFFVCVGDYPLSRWTILLRLIFSGVDLIPPATAVNYIPWAIIGFIFQYVIRRRHFSYWAKYNCMWYCIEMTALITLGVDTDVLSAALDAGTAVGLILIYFWYFLFFFRYLVSRMLIFFFSKPAYNTHWTATSGLIRYNSGGGIRFLRTRWIGKARRFDSLSKAQLLGDFFYLSFFLYTYLDQSSDLICTGQHDIGSLFVFILYR